MCEGVGVQRRGECVRVWEYRGEVSVCEGVGVERRGECV